MTRAIKVLQQEHKSIARLLRLMRHLSDEIDDGDSPDMNLLHEIGDYLSGFPELCHHPKEDLIFRRLQKRAPDALKPGTDLLHEHDQLSGLIETYISSLQNIGSEDSGNVSVFSVKMRELVDAYEHHMEMEEKYFFPACVSKLNANDWAEIDFAVSEQDDPLFDEASTKYARLRDSIFRLADKHEAFAAGHFENQTSILGTVSTAAQLNSIMKHQGLSVKLRKTGDGSYELLDGDRTVLTIPQCSEERATWCAHCFVLGRFSG